MSPELKDISGRTKESSLRIFQHTVESKTGRRGTVSKAVTTVSPDIKACTILKKEVRLADVNEISLVVYWIWEVREVAYQVVVQLLD